MKPDEAQPLTRSIRTVRCFYYASMAVGFPLWLLVTFNLFWWVLFTLWPLSESLPVPFQSLSAIQTGVWRAAGILFFVVYPVAFFWAYRITRRPWVVFAALLLPVLTFCYGVCCFPITDSNSEQRTWLTYLGSLALVLAAGTVAVLVSVRHLPATHEAAA